MIIKNGLVFTEDQKFHRLNLLVSDGKIEKIWQEDDPLTEGDEVVDAAGSRIIPGLVDTHFHGALGYDVCDGTMEAYEKISAYEAKHGITAICPATLTLPVPTLDDVLRTGAAFAENQKKMGADPRHAELVGFNMEGPFVSKKKKGAQNEKYILHCDAKLVDEFLEASNGMAKFIGLAPEENPGFADFIHEVRDRVGVSIAHSDADYETAAEALEAGASRGIHLYNQMTGLYHRVPGIIGALSDDAKADSELITDGVHVHPACVRAAYRMMGADRIVIISDSLRSTGMPDGAYTLGGQKIIKKGSLCTLEDGTIAGSVSNAMDCMRNAVRTMRIPLEVACASATVNAARSIRADDRHGILKEDRPANLVFLAADDSLDVQKVMKDGVFIA